MSEIADPQASLPLPPRHLAANRSAGAADDVAERIFPDHLRFVPDVPPDGTTKIPGGVRALVRFVGEFLRSTLLLPRIIMRGVRHEFDRAAADIHQEFVGSDARLRILGADVGGDAAVDVAADIEKILVAAEGEEFGDVLSPVDRASWTALVTGVFGVVDGSIEFSELRRELLGNDNVVAVDRTVVGDIGDGPLPDVIAKLGGVVAQPAAAAVDGVVDASTPVSQPSGSTGAADEEEQKWTGESRT